MTGRGIGGWLARWAATGLIGVAFCAGPAKAATYLVWTNGSQSAPYDTWDTAFSNLQDAVTAASPAGDALWVTNGTYGVTNSVVVTNGVTVTGVDRDAVIIQRAGTNYHRIFYVSNGVLDSLTIEKGYGGGAPMANYHGLGVYVATGQVLRCIVRNNSGTAQPEHGAGIYLLAGLVADCVITNNSGVGHASIGGGLYVGGGVASNCMIARNTSGSGGGLGGGLGIAGLGLVDGCTIRSNSTVSSGSGGGGVYMAGGTMQNSLIRDNWTGTPFGAGSFPYSVSGNGGGVYMAGAGAVMRNCTVVGNRLYSIYTGGGLWQAAGTVVNSIIYFNGRPSYPWDDENVYKTGGTLTYSCTTPAVAGAGNIVSEPDFFDMAGGDLRLRPGSACIDAGSNIAAVATDMGGSARPVDGNDDSSSLWDIGAYEAENATSGVLRCNAVALTNETLSSLQAVFTAVVAGTNRTIGFYGWDFDGDGNSDLAGAGLSTVTNSYTPGFYTVRLVVTNSGSEGAIATKMSYIRVAPPVTYAATNGGNTFPYDTWEKASTNVLLAVEAAYAKTGGQGVVVGDGIFGLTNVMLLDRPITVRSVNGPTKTVLARKSAAAFRVTTLLRAGSMIEGCAISNGYNNVNPSRGGGVLIFPNTMLLNCIVVSNWSAYSTGYGGGVHMFGGGTLRNCLIMNNKAGLTGGGVYGGLFNVYSYGISPLGRIENCTIVSNVVTGASGYGGGLAGANTTNSIMVNNAASSNENWHTGSVIGYSCSTPLPPGAGNIDAVPIFLNAAASDYRMKADSPCRDQGTNLAWMAGATDLAGGERFFNAGPDMGAYEVQMRIGSVFVVE